MLKDEQVRHAHFKIDNCVTEAYHLQMICQKIRDVESNKSLREEEKKKKIQILESLAVLPICTCFDNCTEH